MRHSDTPLSRAYFSKSAAARAAHVISVAKAAAGPVIYLHPKNASAPVLPGAVIATFEDMEERATWLAINDAASNGATLIIEKGSRYPRVAGSKFKRLQTLTKRVAAVFIVDIVPFTLEPRFLYTTFSYLGTDILGIAKYAAMHEEYEELLPDGRVVSVGKDPAELARRIAPVSSIDYVRFSAPCETVRVESTFAELEQYQAKKDKLFAKHDNPAKIVTRLADFAHAFDSRNNALLGLLKTIEESAIVYVNLASYAARINRALRAAGLTRHKAISYQIGCEDETSVAVFMEAPIVNSHFALDAESRIAIGGRAYRIHSDAKVDEYLSGRFAAEMSSIDALAGEMVTCKTI